MYQRLLYFMFYLYILYRESSDKFYIGITEDYVKRFNEHNSSPRISYTAKHRPWKVVAVFYCGDTLSEALKIEKFIKKQKSRKFIEVLISSDQFSGILSQLVRVQKFRD